jgi:hypothetical protein
LASFTDCINAAIADNKISKSLGDAINGSDDPMGAIEELAGQLSRNRREAAIQAVRLADRWDNVTAHPEGKLTGLMSTMVKDVTGKAGYYNVDMRRRFYETKYHSMIADFLEKYRSRMTLDAREGFIKYDEKALNDLTKAIYGETVDDPFAVKFAADYAKMVEEMRTDFNKMGGSIGKNDRYLMPQNHDASTILKYEKDTGSSDGWISDVKKWIDLDEMTDDAGKKLSPDELDEGLKYAYESITTNGLNKAKDFSAPVGLGKKMARRGSDQRFLFFKDSESWTAYQNKYGRGDVFQTLTSNINMVASDVANMELLGPNPKATYDALMSQIAKEDGRIPDLRHSTLDAVFKVTSGTMEQGNLTSLADFMQSTRNVITASKLGAAWISSISDEGFTAITASYNNLPITRIMATKGKMLGMNSAEFNVFATKLGLGAESWIKTAHSANRYGEVYNQGMTGKAAEVVMRASGLEPWTEAGRKAFTMEFSGYLAENFDTRFADLDSKTMRGFEAYGITEADWNTFRASTPLDFKGAKYANMLENGSEKFHQMIMSEVDYAVPTPDARVRAATTLGSSRASLMGQVYRSATNLKSFAITLMTTHGMRAYHQATLGEQISYAGMMLASTTLLGAVAMTGKDLAKGREPRSMDDTKAFWGAALMQGGGLGIMGDFFFSDVNRFGGGLTTSLLGPTGQLINETDKLFRGNLQQLALGEDTNFAREAVQYIDRNTPNIWQIAPLKNAMFDQLELLVDPKAQKKFNRARKKHKKDYGSDYWWNPGEATPEFAQ